MTTISTTENTLKLIFEWKIPGSEFEKGFKHENFFIDVPDIESRFGHSLWKLKFFKTPEDFDQPGWVFTVELVESKELVEILCIDLRLTKFPEIIPIVTRKHENFIFSIPLIEPKDNMRFLLQGHVMFQATVTVAENQGLCTETVDKSLLKMLETGDHSDVTLIVAEKEFKVHRNILASRSDFFKGMFTNHFKESSESRIPINEEKAEVFPILLEYMYGDKVPKLHPKPLDYLADIYTAADKFGIATLSDICVRYMTKNLSALTFGLALQSIWYLLRNGD